MKYGLILPGILIICVLSTQVVQAQMVYDTLLLDELEILANKVDRSQTVQKTTIDTLFKIELDNLDLGELLAAYTPVYVKSYGKGALTTASFRGTGASHTQVLWNDFQINSPMLGQLDFSQVPNSFIDGIDLYYGGGSLFMSGGALGGSVAIENNSALMHNPQIAIEQTFGSFQSLATNANLLYGNSKFGSDTRFAYQSSENDFTYTNIAVIPQEEMTQTNSAFQNIGFTQQFSWQPTVSQQINIISWNQWNSRDIPSIMTNVNKGGDPQEYQNGFFSRNILSWNYRQNNNSVEVKAAYLYEDQHYYLKTTTNSDSADIVTLIDSENKTNSFYIKSKFQSILKKGFAVTTGFDFDNERVNSNNYDGQKTRNSVALYGNMEKNFQNWFKFNLLVRLEIVDGELVPVMPLLGFNLKLLKSEQFYLRGSISRNYHLPTLNDLYWYPGGNEALDPEKGTQIDGGLSFSKSFSKGFSIITDFGIFGSKIRDWIQWVPSDFRYWSPENIAQVYSRGIDISLHMNGTVKKFIYKVYGEYAYTKTTDISERTDENNSEDDQLLYIPKNMANGFIYGSLSGYYLSWSINYIGERNTTKKPLLAYCLNNISIGKKWYKTNVDVDIRFKVNNLFDIEYQAIQWRAMPGRNYELSIKLRLKK